MHSFQVFSNVGFYQDFSGEEDRVFEGNEILFSNLYNFGNPNSPFLLLISLVELGTVSFIGICLYLL